MSADNFAGVVYTGPTRGAAYADVISQLLEQHRAQQDAQNKSIAEQFMAMRPEQKAAYYPQLPDEVKKFIINPSNVAPAVKTPEEQLSEASTNQQLSDVRGVSNPPMRTGMDMSGVGAGSVPMPVSTPAQSPVDRMASLNRANRSMYKSDLPQNQYEMGLLNQTGGPQAVGQAAQIATKISPTGQEAWTNQNVTAPKTAAEIQKSGVETTKIGAETGKIGQETRGLKQTNDLFGGVVGGAPVASGAASQSLDGASAIVKQIVNRQFDPMLMRRWKPEQQAAIAAQVQQYDPSFSMADYPQQVAAKKAFTSGQYAQNITSVNTLIGHVKTLSDAYTQLNNNRFPTANAVENTAGRLAGNQKIQGALGSFNTAADAVATEAARTFKGAGSTAEREIQEWRKNVSPSMPPAEFNASVDTLFNLLQSRLDQLGTQYTHGVGRAMDFSVLSAKSKAILKNMGRNVDESGNGGGNPDPLGILK